MIAAQQVAIAQRVDVPPDGLGRNGEMLRQRVNRDEAAPPHQIEEKRRLDPRYQPPAQIGLVKALHSVRFPLHDHFRKNKNWSPAQVVVRFLLIQALLTPLLFLLLVKLR